MRAIKAFGHRLAVGVIWVLAKAVKDSEIEPSNLYYGEDES